MFSHFKFVLYFSPRFVTITKPVHRESLKFTFTLGFVGVIHCLDDVWVLFEMKFCFS